MRFHRSILKNVNSRVQTIEKVLPKRLQLKKWNIIKGDEVMIVSGKDRGKTGTITEVSRKTNSVFVRGLKLVARTISTKETPSGKVQKEMPIHISNVALIDPTNGLPTKIKLAPFVYPDTKVKENRRYAVGSGTYIPKKPDLSYQKDWRDGEFDTDPDVVTKASFMPTPDLAPFPDDLMREIKNRYKRHY
ncbi:ribosomal protein L24 [Coemansia reversa NRRL 1564]|uniref:Ribosomal protein L24 n=1 Tax=Coemansia reversa (strain ATCC 12441 / NRRL 1564) TaxID=763665 RepID=A0A2G5B675_COERN|nr:ribosomal protein L24 [Coemansia reversa NRRL 1564]|eukprot:PIA14501.1 ribosomal protein L24 [Coemansia reversa NRRL 1564]